MGNPLRSEAAMFRILVVAVLAAIPVIALGLIGGPGWAIGVLVVEAVALVLYLRRARSAEAE